MSANLSGLTIGSLSLSPEFDPDVMTYAATTTNATNTVTAKAEDPRATIEIKMEKPSLPTEPRRRGALGRTH